MLQLGLPGLDEKSKTVDVSKLKEGQFIELQGLKAGQILVAKYMGGKRFTVTVKKVS